MSRKTFEQAMDLLRPQASVKDHGLLDAIEDAEKHAATHAEKFGPLGDREPTAEELARVQEYVKTEGRRRLEETIARIDRKFPGTPKTRLPFGGREPIDRTKLNSYGPCTACKSTEMTYQPGVRGLDVPERQGVPEDVVCGECGYVVASGLDPAERERWDREIDRD